VEAAIVLGFAGLALSFWKLQLYDPPAARPFALDMLGGADFFKEIVPLVGETARQWLEGQLPLWNPYQLAGRPLLAMPLAGAFYPLNFPFLLFSPATAIEVVIAVHLAAAGIFTYAFARSLPLSQPAAAAAGICFMFSGFVTMTASWATAAVSSIVWLPLGLLAVERIVQKPSARFLPVLALAVCMPLFAGWIQIWTYTLGALGLYALLRVLLREGAFREPRQDVRIVMVLVVGVALGIGLAAAQLLPSQELQSLSSRSGELQSRKASIFGRMPPAMFFRNLVAPATLDPVFAYLGRAALLLLPLGLFARGRGVQILCFASLGALALSVAATDLGNQLFRLLPTASWFREPVRLLFLYVFGGAILVGAALDDLRRGSERARALWLASLVLVIATGAQLATPLAGFGSAMLWISAVLIGAALFSSNARVRTAIVVGLVLLLGLDLFRSREAGPHRPIHAPEVVAGTTDLYDYLRQNQGHTRTLMFARAGLDPATTDMRATAEQIYSMTDYSGLSLSRFGRFYDAIDTKSPDRSRIAFTGDFDPEPTSPRLRMVQLLSLGHLVASPRQAPAILRGFGRELGSWSRAHYSEATKLEVYRASQPLPRAYVAFASMAVADGPAALEAISRPDHPLQHVVVLEGAALESRGRVGRPVLPASITLHRPNQVVVEAQSDEPGFLVLTDTYYPGWKAEIDGDPTEILRANYLFRAVALPPGLHRVTFRYEPLSVRIGLAISLASLVLLLLATARGLRGDG
jgi:hypothetical protein